MATPAVWGRHDARPGGRRRPNDRRVRPDVTLIFHGFRPDSVLSGVGFRGRLFGGTELDRGARVPRESRGRTYPPISRLGRDGASLRIRRARFIAPKKGKGTCHFSRRRFRGRRRGCTADATGPAGGAPRRRQEQEWPLSPPAAAPAAVAIRSIHFRITASPPDSINLPPAKAGRRSASGRTPATRPRPSCEWCRECRRRPGSRAGAPGHGTPAAWAG